MKTRRKGILLLKTIWHDMWAWGSDYVFVVVSWRIYVGNQSWFKLGCSRVPFHLDCLLSMVCPGISKTWTALASLSHCTNQATLIMPKKWPKDKAQLKISELYLWTFTVLHLQRCKCNHWDTNYCLWTLLLPSCFCRILRHILYFIFSKNI